MVTQADVDRAKAASGITPLEKGTRYLLLLKSIAAYYPGKDYYTGQGMPWLLVLSPDGNATIKAPKEVLLNLPREYVPDPNAPLLPQVEQLVRAEKTGAPTK